MKAIVPILIILFSITTFSQTNTEIKKTLVQENVLVKFYVLEKDSITCGRNKILVETVYGDEYRLSVAGGSIRKTGNYWEICISCRYGSRPQNIAINVSHTDKKGKVKSLLSVTQPWRPSPTMQKAMSRNVKK